MLTSPNIPDEKFISCIRAEYDLAVTEAKFLPIGADFRTAVFRITSNDETDYFLKLRSGEWDETAVTLSKFLYDNGISQIISPIPTQSGQLWGNLDDYKTILYPFCRRK